MLYNLENRYDGYGIPVDTYLTLEEYYFLGDRQGLSEDQVDAWLDSAVKAKVLICQTHTNGNHRYLRNPRHMLTAIVLRINDDLEERSCAYLRKKGVWPGVKGNPVKFKKLLDLGPTEDEG